MRSITIGNYISVQGQFVGKSKNGNVTVRVGTKTYTGKPIS